VASQSNESQQLNSVSLGLTLAADVAAALVSQGFSRKAARSAVESVEGNDFDSLFRSAIALLTGSTAFSGPMPEGRTLPGNLAPKPDTVSASNLTSDEETTIREFVTKSKALDAPLSELIALAIKVKTVFASKRRGSPVVFDGQPYMNFDEFVEKNLPMTGRTMRRALAKEGKTDQRFANKQVKPSASLDEQKPLFKKGFEAGKKAGQQPTDTVDWTDNKFIKTCLDFVGSTLQPLESDPKRFATVANAIAQEIIARTAKLENPNPEAVQ